MNGERPPSASGSASTSTGTCAARAGQEGMALLLALLFIVLLAAIVVEYAYENRVEATFVENSSAEFEAEVAAKSAVAAGLSLLAADIQIQQLYDLDPRSGSGSRAPRDPQQGGTGDGRVTSFLDAWAMGIPYRPINDAVMQCLISDEYGKINLNALLLEPTPPGVGPGQTPEPPPAGQGAGLPGTETDGTMRVENEVLIETLRRLFELRGADTDPVDAILDWIDPDEDPRPDGAESDFYQRLEIPYSAKNAHLDSVEELLLIKGVTPEVFFGDPKKDQVPLTELLTVQGSSRGQVNPNTAHLEVLQALGEALGQSRMAEVILEEREYAPLSDNEQLQRAGVLFDDPNPGEPPPVDPVTGMPMQQTDLRSNPFVFASDVFRLRGNGQSGEAAVQIETYVYRNPNAFSQDTYTNANPRRRAADRMKERDPKDAVGTRSRSNRGQSRFAEETPQPFRILDWRVTK